MMMMRIRPFGQLGLRAPSSGVQDAFTSSAYLFTYAPVIEESGHPRYGQEAPVVCRQIPEGVKEHAEHVEFHLNAMMMTMIIIIMLIISPFGQLGLWAPSSGV
jgi:hypothetical protein